MQRTVRILLECILVFHDSSFPIFTSYKTLGSGNGSVAQVVLSDILSNSKGTFLSINLGYGLAVTFGVYVAGGVSGTCFLKNQP